MNKNIILLVLLTLNCVTFSQGRLVLTGNTYIVIDNNAKLVTSNANAVINTGTGGIKTESEFDQLVWIVGTNTGAYTVPFVGSIANIQIPFTANITTAGVGTGEIRFSTYPGATWDNNTYRPSDVTHMFDYNTNTINNSSFVIDRFWIIDPLNYTTKPAGNFNFTYIDAEHTALGNSIVEANLGAQRFNSGPNIWGDYLPQGTTNTAANTTTAVPVSIANFFRSWTLSLITNPLFNSIQTTNIECSSESTVLNWMYDTPMQTSYFKLFHVDENGTQHHLENILYTNTNVYSYETTITGGFFELFAVENDSDEYSIAKMIPTCQNEIENSVYLFNNILTISINNIGKDQDIVSIYDASGSIVKTFEIQLLNGFNQIQVPIENLASGIYFVKTEKAKLNNCKLYK